MSRKREWTWETATWLWVGAVAFFLLAGCTPTSTKLAIAGSERSDGVRSFVTAEQHRSLKVLLFRETLTKLKAAQTDEVREAVLNDAWNDRDLFEFWYLQDCWARALHYATVDAKLASSKSMASLIAKDIAIKLQEPVQAADEYLAAKLGQSIASSQPAGP